MFLAWLRKYGRQQLLNQRLRTAYEACCSNVEKCFFLIETLCVNRLPNSLTNLVLYLSDMF